jgi:hypothetical protein
MQTFILPHIAGELGNNGSIILANREFDRCLAAMRRRLSGEEVIFGLSTALKLLMIEVPRHQTSIEKDDLCVWAPRPEARVQMKGVFSFTSSLPVEIVQVERAGEIVLCTDPISTCMQMSGYLSREETTVLFDILTRRERADKVSNEEELWRVFESAGPFKGKVAAQWALKHHRMNTDSSMETRLRLALEEARFPAPSVNPMFRDPDSGEIWYLDMAYIDLGIAFEYQGRLWHSSANSLDNDSHKSLRLHHFGCKVIAVTSESLTIPWRRTELIDSVRRARRQQQKLSKRQKHSFANLFTEQENLGNQNR